MALTDGPRQGGLQQRERILSQPGDQKPKIKVSQGHAPSEGSRGGSCLPLPASGGPWHPRAGGRIPPASASIFSALSVFSLLMGTLAAGFRDHQKNQDPQDPSLNDTGKDPFSK